MDTKRNSSEIRQSLFRFQNARNILHTFATKRFVCYISLYSIFLQSISIGLMAKLTGFEIAKIGKDFLFFVGIAN